MTTYRSVFWLNSLSLLLIAALIAYAKLAEPSVGGLFLPPPSPPYPSAGLLTHTFQILCSVPPFICAFSFGLLRKTQPQSKQNRFILYSALLTAGFLINEIYRIHIILSGFGIPKLTTILVYAIAVLVYAATFWHRIKSTPYFLLLTGLGLLFVAIAIDSLHLKGDGTPSLLEGIPKLFSELNIVLYFWYVCYQNVLRSFERKALS